MTTPFTSKSDGSIIYAAHMNQAQNGIQEIAYSVKAPNYNAAGNGVAFDDTPIDSCITDVGDAGGGVVFLPPGNFKIANLKTLATPNVSILGCGTDATKITCTSTTGAFKVTASNVKIGNLWIHCTGAGAWAIDSDRGRIFSGRAAEDRDDDLEGRGNEALRLWNLKITGASGIGGGIRLINTWFSRVDDIHMPGGDGVAFQIQSGGFNHISHVIATQHTTDPDTYGQWDDVLELKIQPDMFIPMDATTQNSVQQADDNLFENVVCDNYTRYGLYIHTQGTGEILGVGPGRNTFVNCRFLNNGVTYPQVKLESAYWTKFFGCHAEAQAGHSLSYNWHITDKAVGNAWVSCSGEVLLDDADAYQTIQGNSFRDHIQEIVIADVNVWGTTIYDAHNTVTDGGTDTHIYYVPIGTAGSLEVSHKIPWITFNDRNTSGTGTTASLYGFHNAPDDAKGSNGDFGFRDNPTAGAALYKKEAGIWFGIAGHPYRVLATIRKASISDNVAAAAFTITTTNESGDNDGGAYICNVTALVAHTGATGATTAANNAARQYRGSFSRIMIATGSGVNTAVENNTTGASAASDGATRQIDTVTMSVAETSEYVQTVSFTVDLNGSSIQTAEVICFIEVLHTGFTTPPVIAAA